MSWKERWDHFKAGLIFTNEERSIALTAAQRGRVGLSLEARHRIDLSTGSETLDD